MIQNLPFFREMLPVVFMLGGGFLLKWVDEVGDRYNSERAYEYEMIGVLSAIVTGMGLGWVAAQTSMWGALVFGIILGVFITGKIDTVYLWLGVLVSIIGWMYWGSFSILGVWGIVWAFVVSFGVAFDEIGHEATKGVEANRVLAWFFEYRWTLRTLVIVMFIGGFVDGWNVLGIWLFDLGYLFGEKTFPYS